MTSSKSLLRSVAGYSVIRGITQIIPFILIPILTRRLKPDEYANISLYTFYISIFLPLCGSAAFLVNSKYFFIRSKQYIAELNYNLVVFSLALSLIVTVCVIVLDNIASGFFQLDKIWIYTLPSIAVLYNIFFLQQVNLRNQNKIVSFGYFQIGNSILDMTLSIFFVVVIAIGWKGRILGIILTTVLSAFLALYYLKKNEYLKVKFSIQKVRKIYKLMLPLIPDSVNMVVIAQAGIFFVSKFYGKYHLGVYFIGFQIASAVQLLVITIYMAWNPFLFEQLSNNIKDDRIRITKLLYVIYSAVSFCGILLLVLSKYLLRIFTTSDYFGASLYLPWLIFGFVFYAMYMVLIPILVHFNKQVAISIISLSGMLLIIVLNLIMSNMGTSVLIAVNFLITYLLMFAAGLFIIQKVYPLPWAKSLIELFIDAKSILLRRKYEKI